METSELAPVVTLDVPFGRGCRKNDSTPSPSRERIGERVMASPLALSPVGRGLFYFSHLRIHCSGCVDFRREQGVITQA